MFPENIWGKSVPPQNRKKNVLRPNICSKSFFCCCWEKVNVAENAKALLYCERISYFESKVSLKIPYFSSTSNLE